MPKFLTALLVLAVPSISHSQIDKDSAIRAIHDFKTEESSDKLLQCINRIEREPSFSENSRAEMLVTALAATVQYLETHPKPAETPQINMAPPDGGIAGADPESVKDPAMRVQYEKEIAANKALAEAHRKHRAISAMRDKLVTYCVSFSNLKPENKKILSDYVRSASNDPRIIKTLAALIENKDGKRDR